MEPEYSEQAKALGLAEARGYLDRLVDGMFDEKVYAILVAQGDKKKPLLAAAILQELLPNALRKAGADIRALDESGTISTEAMLGQLKSICDYYHQPFYPRRYPLEAGTSDILLDTFSSNEKRRERAALQKMRHVRIPFSRTRDVS